MSHSLFRNPHAIVVFLALFIQSCGGSEKNDNRAPNPYAEVQVNPAFATNPPIASDIKITPLESPDAEGNVLFEATLSKETLGSDVLAITVNDTGKIVLHDDGENGDRAKGDGVYSTLLKEDTAHMKTFLQTQATMVANKRNETITKFVGRNMIRDTTRSFDKARIQFRKGNAFDFTDFPFIQPVTETLKRNALMVTDVGVVADPARTFNPCRGGSGTPGGAWTFGKLISEMANTPATGISPEDFLMNWFQTWQRDHSINGDAVPARNRISEIIDDWRAFCGGPGAPLDVNKAPFRLLAIVNRFDLRGNGGYAGGNAGEGRFVFCSVNQACSPERFLVIFEYGVNKKTCSAKHAYAEQWIDLASETLGSASYNAKLQAITDQFTLAGTNNKKPNGSSLNQIRTNEIALGSPWELREFNIGKASHRLENVTTKREPQVAYNSQGGSPDVNKVIAFGEFVNANEARVIADKMEIPATLSVNGITENFLSAHALTRNATTFHWNARIVAGTGFINSDEARSHISLNACSGCHGGETNTGNFTHVGLPFGSGEAVLSKFLTGDPAFSGLPFMVSDRARRPSPSAPAQWAFNDLERRGRDLLDFAGTACIRTFPIPREKLATFPPLSVQLSRVLTFEPLTMTH